MTCQQRLYVGRPERWGPDHPYLYACRASLIVEDEEADEEHTTFGIRSLALDPQRGLRINGESVHLRGACVHHDNGPIGAATFDRAEERRVERLKSAGFNAIRSAHNPMSKAMLAACDRLGLIVMDEAFDAWTQPKKEDDYSLRFSDWWERDIEAMVNKDFNHPSVVFYSIGNEILESGNPEGAHRGRALAKRVRALDDSRFVTEAFSGLLLGAADLFVSLNAGASDRNSGAEREASDENRVTTMPANLGSQLAKLMRSPIIAKKSEETMSYLDVAGYNYMEPRLKLDGELYPNRVIVATETLPASIDTGWFAVMDNPHVIGDFTWTGWDYLGEAGIGRIEYGDPGSARKPVASHEGGFPWLTAWCGDIDITGHRRPQSYYREIVFGLRRAPYLAIRRPQEGTRTVVYESHWSWSDVVSSWTWDIPPASAVVVEVYSDGDEVELLLNGVSLGRKPTGPAHRFRGEFEVHYEPGVLEAIAWRQGAEVGRSVLRSASGPIMIDLRSDRAQITSQPCDLAFVEVELVDEAGTLVSSADRTIAVALDGPGELQGFGSANPVSEEVFTNLTCTTFDGRALAVVRPTADGVITLTATADGCEPSAVQISVQS